MYSNIIVAPLCAVGLQKRARLGSNVGSRQEAVRRRTTRRAPSHDARFVRFVRESRACARVWGYFGAWRASARVGLPPTPLQSPPTPRGEF